jgi:hypothetical protein
MNAASRAAHLDFAGPPSLTVQRPANQNPASRKRERSKFSKNRILGNLPADAQQLPALAC